MAMGSAAVRKACPISVAEGQIKTSANGGAAVDEAKIRSITFLSRNKHNEACLYALTDEGLSWKPSAAARRLREAMLR